MKLMQKLSLALTSALAAAGTAVAQTTPSAVDYSPITEAADWSTVASGVILVFVGLAFVLVAISGGKKLLSVFRG